MDDNVHVERKLQQGGNPKREHYSRGPIIAGNSSEESEIRVNDLILKTSEDAME